jgi:hypothetical protein
VQGELEEAPAVEYERCQADRRKSVMRLIQMGQVGWMLSITGTVVVVALARARLIGPDVMYPVVGTHVAGAIAAGFAAGMGLWNRSLLSAPAALLAFGPWLVVCVISSFVLAGYLT